MLYNVYNFILIVNFIWFIYVDKEQFFMKYRIFNSDGWTVYFYYFQSSLSIHPNDAPAVAFIRGKYFDKTRIFNTTKSTFIQFLCNEYDYC